MLRRLKIASEKKKKKQKNSMEFFVSLQTIQVANKSIRNQRLKSINLYCTLRRIRSSSNVVFVFLSQPHILTAFRVQVVCLAHSLSQRIENRDPRTETAILIIDLCARILARISRDQWRTGQFADVMNSNEMLIRNGSNLRLV